MTSVKIVFRLKHLSRAVYYHALAESMVKKHFFFCFAFPALTTTSFSPGLAPSDFALFPKIQLECLLCKIAAILEMLQ